MIRLIITLLALSTLTSCGVYRQKVLDKYCKADSVTTIKIDSFISHTRDTFYTGGDTVRLHDTLKVDCVNGKPRFKPSSGSQRTKNVVAKYTIDTAGILNIYCMTDSLMHIIDSLQLQINKDTTTRITKVRDETSPVWRWLAIIGWLLIVIIFAIQRITK